MKKKTGILIFIALCGLSGFADRHSSESPRPKAIELQKFPEVTLRLSDILAPKRALQTFISAISALGPDSSRIQDFERVFKLPNAQTLVCDKGKFASLYQVAKDKLKSMPEKLKSYQDTEGPASKAQVLAGLSGGNNLNHLDDVAYHYPFTEGAREALTRLTYIHLDHGQPAIAAIYADALLEDFSWDTMSSGTLIRLAFTYGLANQKEKSKLLLDILEEKETVSKERFHSLISLNEKQDSKTVLRRLAISKDPKERELFLRVARIGSLDTLMRKLGLKEEGLERCLVLAPHEKGDEFFVESAKLKMQFGAPLSEVLEHFDFVEIKPGRFVMGSPDGTTKDANGKVIAAEPGNEVPHEVEVKQAFQMQTTEVTQDLYELVQGKNPSRTKAPNNPVENVSWDDAEEFIKKLNALDPTHHYRLPTEVEWEYAARAGTNTAYSFGSDVALLSEYANFGRTNDGHLEVAKLKKNAWGLFDMHGNVREWTMDKYTNDTSKVAVDSDFGHPVNREGNGSLRVMRGGSWYDGAQLSRSAHRYYNHTGARYDATGLRLVRTPRLQSLNSPPIRAIKGATNWQLSFIERPRPRAYPII